MVTKFNLIKSVDTAVKQRQADEAKFLQEMAIVYGNIELLAEQHNVTVENVVESVTHVLANIAQTASSGGQIKAMNAASVAAFMAGVEKLASIMPQASQPQQQNALRVLTSVSIGPDGHVTPDAAKIAQLGSKDVNLHQKYTEIVSAYLKSVNMKQPAGNDLITAARKLQQTIDNAMQQAKANSKFALAKAPPSTGEPQLRAQAQAPQREV